VNLKQEELARPIGYHNSVVSRVERNEQLPAQAYLEGIIKTLNLSESESRELWDVFEKARASSLCISTIEYMGAHQAALTDSEQLAPFVVGPPIAHPNRFFGRELELKQVFDLWRRFPLQNAAVTGLRRSGKTSFLHYIRNITSTPSSNLRPGQRTNWLPYHQRYHWIMVDFQDARLCQMEWLLRYLLSGMNLPIPQPCSLHNFIDTVSNRLRTPTIILLDEIDVALTSPALTQQFWLGLRSLGSNQTEGNLAFLLASSVPPAQLAENRDKSSPFFNIFGHSVKLGPLSESAARELIASSPRPFAEDDVTWILTESKCWPALLQSLCYTRLSALDDADTGVDWHTLALHQIEPMCHLLERS
jgi:hypothetical protein